MASELHISLAAEPIAHVGSFPITNSLFMTWLAMAVLIIFAFVVRSRIKKIPSGIQNLFEVVVEFFLNLVQSVTQNAKQTTKFFPIVFTLFIFILVSNYLGILPGVGTITLTPAEHHNDSDHSIVPGSTTTTESGDTHEELVQADNHAEDDAHQENADHNATAVDDHADEPAATAKEEGHGEAPIPLFRPPNADLNATLAWAILAVIFVQILGISELGGLKYIGKFIPFHKLVAKREGKRRFSALGLIDLFVGGLEIVSEFAKIVSFSFRLFGNVFAGEVLLVVMGFLAAFIAPIPFYGLELFVGLIQALVFAMLTLVFLKIATSAH